MPSVTLIPATVEIAAELLRFEQENRKFFEARINARPATFYSLAAVREALELAECEAREDKGYQYLIRSEGRELIGRVNLSRVRRAHFHSAELGYRVGQAAGGKGYASEAVRQAVEKAFGELDLMRVEANSRAENEASVRVLQRNGFVQYGHSRRSFELGGVWYDRLHFEKHRSA